MLLRVQLLEVLGVLLNPGHPFSLSSVVSLMQMTPSSLDVLDAAMKYGEKIFKKQFLKALSCAFLFFFLLNTFGGWTRSSHWCLAARMQSCCREL